MLANGLEFHRYQEELASAWDQLLDESVAATFLQSRRFLSYHGDRFQDRSVLVRREGRLVAALPAAEDRASKDWIVSHPGITYGGWLHRGDVDGTDTLKIFETLACEFRQQGYRLWRYKPVPWIYHRVPSESDLYALFRLGAQVRRLELSRTIDLGCRLRRSERRRRGERKAGARGVVCASDPSALADFWVVLDENLRERYGKRPVHSFEEIAMLRERFPREIELLVARLEGSVVAGTVLFHTATTTHAQYIASSALGREVGALDAVFERAIADAAARGMRYFDFGISTEAGGAVLNENLDRFKQEFGSGSTVYPTFELEL